MVKLAEREMVQMIPALSTIIRLVETAVAANDHVPAVLRIDPEGVLIGVYAAVAFHLEGLAAVLRAIHLHAEDVDDLLVQRIDADLGEVHRPRIEAIDAGPGFTAVGGFVDAAGLVSVGPLLVLDIFALAAK